MQTIWITGGSSGIGFAVAQKFLEENWRVVISSRNEDRLKKAVIDLKNITSKKEIYYKACDVSKYKEVKETITHIENKISKINIALLNATAYSPNRNQEFDIKNYNLLIDVNLNGTINCIDVLKNYMKGRNNLISIVSSPRLAVICIPVTLTFASPVTLCSAPIDVTISCSVTTILTLPSALIE